MSILAALASATVTCASPVVHDGDTIRCGQERVRLVDIDAPELPGSPRCTDPRRNGWCDFELAFRSRDALRGFLARGPAEIRRHGVDRYGRTLARVTAGGRDAGAYLVERGLAKPFRKPKK